MKKTIILPALFAISISAFSQINTFDVNQTLIGPGILTFDFNNDGTNDFSFNILALAPPNGNAARVLPEGYSAILDNSTYGYPDALDDGDAVTGYFHSNVGVLGTFTNAGQFKGAGDKYLGIKIKSAGNDYFGWIKLNCSFNRDTLRIISCGYNTIASSPIDAGQTVVSGIEENELKPANINIYPNPFSTQTVIYLDKQLHDGILTVVNSAGQTVAQITNINSRTIPLDRNNLATGLYFVSLTEENKLITTQKLVIQN